tara:strand:- start:17607 stop:18782 length:1176 start_codon:yes stop_codon:yes gene_type:complete
VQKITTDIVIIGAGAAGMMAAHFCALKGKQVYLLDHNKQVGRKILISGGGKCNFTNIFGSSAEEYHSENKHFVKSALSRYTCYDFLELIEKNKIPYEQREVGKLFCLRSAKDIVNALLEQLQKPNIHLKLEQKNLDVEIHDDGFRVFNSHVEYFCNSLVIATGGIVLPSIGASDFGHKLAKRVGHKILPMSPALVPFKVEGWSELSGNAIKAGITCNGYYVAENVLFTHKGLSGPGVLKASLFWNPGDFIEINWLPQYHISDILKSASGQKQLNSVLSEYLPKSFIKLFFEKIDFDSSIHIAKISKKEELMLEKNLHHMVITPSGTEGFRKAEVTRGGVSTEFISSKTMESKLQKKLYFIGEVLDVTGQLGGHNFQWCWASAYAVGQAIAE